MVSSVDSGLLPDDVTETSINVSTTLDTITIDDDPNRTKTESELLLEKIIADRYGIDGKYKWLTQLAGFDYSILTLRKELVEQTIALNERYDALRERITYYEQALQDLTMDDNIFTMDDATTNMTGYTFLSRAAEWDAEITAKIGTVSSNLNTIKDTVKTEIINELPKAEDYIDGVITEIEQSKPIKNLEDKLLNSNSALNDLISQHNQLKDKQYADHLEAMREVGIVEDRVNFNFSTLLDEQVRLLAEETDSRIDGLRSLEDGIILEQNSRMTADASLNELITTVKSSSDSGFAAVQDSIVAVTDQYNSLASRTEELISEFETTTANILVNYVTKVDQDNALALYTTTVRSEIDDKIATIDMTNAVDRGSRAVSTVVIDNNGVMSGYGLISDLIDGKIISAFGVNADNFYIGSPVDGKKMFTVNTTANTVNGVDYPAGVYIDVANIADGTIGNAKITNASIDTAKIKDASITDAKIVNLSSDKLTVPTAKPFDSKANLSDVLITGTVTNAEALFDGLFKFGSSVCSFGQGDGTENIFLQVDFKEERLIKDIVLWFDTTDGRTHKYKLLTSSDGVNWKYLVGSPTYWAASSKPLLNVYGTYVNTATATRSYSGLGLACRYIKIVGNGNDIDTFNKLYELEVFSEYSNLVIDGNGIIANSVRAEALQVTDLSAISANLGNIKVDTAHIEDLAVTTLKIGNRAITSSITQTQALNWNVSATTTAGVYGTYTWTKDATLHGFENSTVGANALLFLQPITSTITCTNPTSLEMQVYLNNILVGVVPSGLMTKIPVYEYRGNGEDYGNVLIGYESSRYVFTASAMMFPITISQAMINESITITLKVVVQGQSSSKFPVTVTINVGTLSTYLVEFKR